jgi:type II secretory pathway component PulC
MNKMNFKRILLLANICLSALIIWTAVHIVLTWRSGTKGDKKPQALASHTGDSGKSSAQRPKPLEHYGRIIHHDIFNTLENKPAKSIEKRKITKLTDLKIKLRGTVVGKTHQSFAIIFDRTTQKEDLYRINDFLQGARIAAILSDRVILNVDGKMEVLPLEEDSNFTDVRAGPIIKKRSQKRAGGKGP